MLLRPSITLLIFILLLLSQVGLAKRRKGGGSDDRLFESRPGMGEIVGDASPSSAEDESNEGGSKAATGEVKSISPDSDESTNATTTTTPALMRRNLTEEVEIVRLLNDGVASTASKPSSQRQAPRDDVGLIPSDQQADNVLWIDSTYKAEDAGMNISGIAECQPWERYWENNSTLVAPESLITFFIANAHDGSTPAARVEEPSSKAKNPTAKGERIKLVEYELIDEKERLEELGLPPLLLDDEKEAENYKIGVLFKELCGRHEREFVYKTTEDAKEIGIDAQSAICHPFKEQLHPSVEALAELSTLLNALVPKEVSDLLPSTGKSSENKSHEHSPNATSRASDDRLIGKRETKPLRKEAKDLKSISPAKPGKDSSAIAAIAEEKKEGAGAEEVDEEWLEDVAVPKQILDTEAPSSTGNETGASHAAGTPLGGEAGGGEVWVQIDVTDETAPVMYLLSATSANALNLTIPEHHFQRYERVGLFLPGICAEYIPTAVESFDASEFEGVNIEGPIGVNISALEAAGVNLTELAEKLRNDTEVDDILVRVRNESAMRELGGSYILPVLNKNQYDAYSPPIVFQGSAVVVRLGVYIESMSNFQTSTMDYDMDIYLLMAWRDARLVTPYKRPILVKEEEILEKLWRPDPYFDAKEAEFHEVTFLNFLMRIYTNGLVLYETRIKLKPACNLVLCKYPHDKQTCELQVKSFAYPLETVRFEWFTRKEDAMDKNPEVKLPELYIDRYEPTQCHNRTRRSGDFSCLRAVFRLKRDVGFHIAQTYIPTSLALMFSWVGVWLPEEFMEGRIGVAITVLLTLSTESAGAREHLPSVSYLKAIDLWFGYITGFVFFTLLQTLFVIGFDKRANQLRKWANKRRVEMSQEARDALYEKAERYHKSGRYLDNFCRVFYPLSFLLFLIAYYFVFTEGRQDDCIAARN